jgi:hypothetical protein
MTQEQQPEVKPRKRKGCFFWGCMTSIGIVVIAALVISVVFFNLPQKIGLVKPASFRLLSQTPNREAAQQIKSELQEMGLITTGVEVYVFPERNSDSSVMLTVLDASKGFYFPSSQSTDAVADYLIHLAEVSSENSISRVAFDYHDTKGNSLVSLTAPVESVLKYSRGQISRTEFLKAIDAHIDYSQLVTSVMP